MPNYNSPSVNPATPSGFQLLVTGAFAATRIDVGYFMTAATSFARDIMNFTNSDNRFVTEWGGDGVPIPGSDFYGRRGWDSPFQAARAANQVLTDIPKVVPAYSAADQASIAGVMQTLKALNFMYLAEYRDTAGVPVGDLTNTNINVPAPILCNKNVWQYVVALLDSGNVNLNAGGPAIPITLPGGFSAVSASPGPSTAAHSFASFNRALAGKANLQLAYAIARATAGTAPTPTTPGVPDPTALTRADSAILASALYSVTALVPPSPGGFSDPNAVYHSFSGASGDVPNPFQVGIATLGTLRVMNEFVASVDTADLRWRAKFVVNTNPVQQQAYAVKSSNFIVNFYPSVASPIPIIRNEELVLLRAQVRLGLGDYPGAWTLINAVRTTVGGRTAVPVSASFVTTRDTLLAEQRISTVLEDGADRMISLRMYGLAAVRDTTWGAGDTHATLLPVPTNEANARHGNVTPACS